MIIVDLNPITVFLTGWLCICEASKKVLEVVRINQRRQKEE